MNRTILEKKLSIVRKRMAEVGVEAWLTFSSESGTGGDPLVKDLLGGEVVSEAAIIVYADSVDAKDVAIVADFDRDIAKLSGHWDVIHYHEGIIDPLRKAFERKPIWKVGINNSNKFPVASGLRAAELVRLGQILPMLADAFLCAEELIIGFRGVLLEDEVERLRKAVAYTEEIFEVARDFIKPGVTELEVQRFMQTEVENRGLEYSWGESGDPLVFFGKRTGLGEHGLPTKAKLARGDLVIIDFGVRYEGYASDVMRTFYLPKKGERKPPAKYREAFDTVIAAIDRAARMLKPGVLGNEVDVETKKLVASRGFDPVAFCTGHPLGRTAHEVGPLLGPDTPRYRGASMVKVQEGMAYTLEPIVKVPGEFGIGIEENVLVTPKGAEFVTKRQKDLIFLGRD